MSLRHHLRRLLTALLLPLRVIAALPVVIVAPMPTSDDALACFTERTGQTTLLDEETVVARPRPDTIPIEECVQFFDQQRGKACGSSDGVEVKVRNQCTELIDAKYCLEQTNGRWDCGSYSGMKPDEKTGYYTCHGTGRTWHWARRTGSRVPIPDPNRPKPPSPVAPPPRPQPERQGVPSSPSTSKRDTGLSRPTSYEGLEYSQRDNQGHLVQRAIWKESGRLYCSQSPQGKGSPQTKCVYPNGSSPYLFKELYVGPGIFTYPGKRRP